MFDVHTYNSVQPSALLFSSSRISRLRSFPALNLGNFLIFQPSVYDIMKHTKTMVQKT